VTTTVDDGPVVSIIVRTLNEAEQFPLVLQAIQRQAIDVAVEIVVVDSGSSDATVAMAEAAGARIVRLTRPFRPGYAVNAGAEASRGRICVTLSAGAFPVNDGWLAPLVTPLLGGDGPVATFSRHVSLPHACPIEDAFNDTVFTPRATSALYSASSGAFLRTVWDRLRWNEDIPVGGPDDREWALRVQADGMRIDYAPESMVYRSHGLTAGQWFRRVQADAFSERLILSSLGTASRPARSGVALARATAMSLWSQHEYAELVRFAVLTPLLAVARAPVADRLVVNRTAMRVLDGIGAVDHRVFRPAARWHAAVADLYRSYWAVRDDGTGLGAA
jgi:hypothetical protein